MRTRENTSTLMSVVIHCLLPMKASLPRWIKVKGNDGSPSVTKISQLSTYKYGAWKSGTSGQADAKSAALRKWRDKCIMCLSMCRNPLDNQCNIATLNQIQRKCWAGLYQPIQQVRCPESVLKYVSQPIGQSMQHCCQQWFRLRLACKRDTYVHVSHAYHAAYRCHTMHG